MFDVIGQNAGTIIVSLIIMWILQFALTYWQMGRFYRRLKEIRKDGLTAVGMSGGRYQGRAYGVITVDENNRVMHAERFAGWTVFSGLRQVPEMAGMTLEEVLDESRDLPVSKKLQSAFRKAATDLLMKSKQDEIGDSEATAEGPAE